MKIWKILIIICAVIAVWFGLKIIGLKFYRIPTGSMENSIPAGTRIMAWKMNFKPSRFEIIVFRNPERDTVTIPYSPVSYYSMIRSMNKQVFDSQYKKYFVPLNKREKWIGRCVGLPGDTIRISDSKLIVNGDLYQNPDIKNMHILKVLNNQSIDPNTFQQLKIKQVDINHAGDRIIINITQDQANQIRKLPAFESLSQFTSDKNTFDPNIFPHSDSIHWNSNNFGELIIPKKGTEIKLDKNNISIYARIIGVYEHNDLKIADNNIIINGNKTDTFVPKMDYYFIIGDNRDNSVDSRYWGFLPENHIYGKVLKKFK
jgi:signal peptidase I